MIPPLVYHRAADEDFVRGSDLPSPRAAGRTPPRADPRVADWPVTEGAAGGGRYSPLADITRENVSKLRVAWTYRHGDFWRGSFPLR